MRSSFGMALFAATALSSPLLAQAPEGYPEGYGDIVAAAAEEGKLVVYSVTSAVPLLLEDFQKLYPDVKLEYVSGDTGPLYDQIISESAATVAPFRSTADVVWSSAMDLQLKLVADGHALAYESPEVSKLPSWAVWKNEAFGTSCEPIGFAYNKELVDEAEVPHSRADLIKLLSEKPDKFRGKVTTFDPEKSGLGYFLMTQDLTVAPDAFPALAKALGASDVFLGSGTGAQFTRMSEGESLIGYNMLTSYAAGRAKKDHPKLGYVLPEDYALVLSRVMFITKYAEHPNAAKLWVDYLLSKRGQEMLVASDLGSLREDVPQEEAPCGQVMSMGDAMKPIAIAESSAAYLDPEKRAAVMEQWNGWITAQ
ncbi:MAG: ABC transporter substrate-binding protein [Amaricoccus sp.]